ncbi:MAG: DUF1735 domain-containing protein [Prevotella sp.]|nr:DUF1735 domain-containing protein [Prevotella sp.]
MKTKYSFITGVIALMLTSFYACTNEDWHFDDFDYTTSYFPWQYPIRTIVLGEVDYDNTNDLNHSFIISARMGGVYENGKDQQIEFVVDENLCNNLSDKNSGNNLLPMPKEYYSLENDNTIIIPKGSMSGGVKVQLNDNFFQDPLALGVNYVIPMRIIRSTTDSILCGNPQVDNADCRDETQWKVAPKDFTLFAVNFINKYHGKYLLRGKTICKGEDGKEISKSTYHQQYIEKDIVTDLQTASLTSLNWENTIRVSSGNSPGVCKMIINVSESGKCQIKEQQGASIKVDGEGEWIDNGDAWGGKARDVFHLQYKTEVNGLTYEITDTLVFRDNTVSTKEFTPMIMK